MKERKANRLIGYDYSNDNLYFITSCVQGRVCCFGEVKNAEMVLNDFGKIAEQQWHWLGTQYGYITMHQFVVMPNHIHGIIEIKIKSLSELMGEYKTTSSKKIHLLGYNKFAWQRSFHDHIIRDEKSFETISNYILNNPSQWEQDKFYKI